MLLQAAQHFCTARCKPAPTLDRPQRPFRARYCPRPTKVQAFRKTSTCSAHSGKNSSPRERNSNFNLQASRLLPLLPLLTAFPAEADNINYAPGAGADVVKNLGGLLYAGLLAYWLYIIIGRRVKRAQTEVYLRFSPERFLFSLS